MKNDIVSKLAEVVPCRAMVDDYSKRLDEACVEYYETGKTEFPALSRAEDEYVADQCESVLRALTTVVPDALERWNSITYPISKYNEMIEVSRDMWVRRRDLLRSIEIGLRTRLEFAAPSPAENDRPTGMKAKKNRQRESAPQKSIETHRAAKELAPVVYLSYAWIDVERDGRVVRVPDPRCRQLAESLRGEGIDVRLDLYAHEGLHGQRQPLKSPGDPRDPWHVWAMGQIEESDVVVMVCTPEYVNPDSGEAGGAFQQWAQLDSDTRIKHRARALWWDWFAILKEIDSKPQKFVPVGWGPYNPDWVPGFVRGASYHDLNEPNSLQTLLRRIRQVWHDRVPRSGVFISYAHDDDDKWLRALQSELQPLTDQHGVSVWTDREIAPGDNWHLRIQNALDRATVGILLVTPKFLQSSYIKNDELPKMLLAAESEGLKIFWLPVMRTDLKANPIAKFQAAHAPDQPLAELSTPKVKRALAEAVTKLRQLLALGPDNTASRR